MTGNVTRDLCACGNDKPFGSVKCAYCVMKAPRGELPAPVQIVTMEDILKNVPHASAHETLRYLGREYPGGVIVTELK